MIPIVETDGKKEYALLNSLRREPARPTAVTAAVQRLSIMSGRAGTKRLSNIPVNLTAPTPTLP